MIRWLLCKVFGHKIVLKAYTGQTMLATNYLGQTLTVSLYKWERQKFCTRCGKPVPESDNG